ncbi:MAG: DUF2330 domain-containing protein [Candidatus Berkelbacteria bacterium]|nr:DUF2330 domain-containing protein [Candidatus Berkelbacteria bacterium]
MRKVKISFAIVFASLLLITAGAKLACADGGIYVPPNYYGYETSQQAFIYYTGQTETLVISAGFRGDAKDFSWVIPLPAKPEIDKAQPGLFRTLDGITKTTRENYYLGSSFSRPDSSQMSSVEVISEKTVDMYNTAVLKASDEKSLSSWLTSHGYNFPADQNTALKSYVDGGWYFAVARIQPSLVNDPSTGRALAHGDLTPLKFAFTTDKIIYPMKLTGVVLRSILPQSADNSVTQLPAGAQPEIVSTGVPLTLYVLSTGEVEQNALSTDYANWLSEGNKNGIKADLSGTNISSDKLFLTKLSATFAPKQITDDLIITPAGNDSIYPAPTYKTLAFWLLNLSALVVTLVVAILSPPALIFIVFALLQRFAIKRKSIYILASIYQIIFCLLPIIAWLLFYLVVSGSQDNFILTDSAAGISLGLLLILVAAVFLTIKMLKYRKNVLHQMSGKIESR